MAKKNMVHTYVRHVYDGSTPVVPGSVPAAQVDRDIADYLDQGWKIQSSHVLAVGKPEGTFQLMYILVKEND